MTIETFDNKLAWNNRAENNSAITSRVHTRNE